MLWAMKVALSSVKCMAYCMSLQEAHSTIDSLQTQVVDLEVQLRQGKASIADLQQSSTAEIRRLQNQLTSSKAMLADLQQTSSAGQSQLQAQLRKAQQRAADDAESGTQLESLTSEVAQLRVELGSMLSQALAPITTAPAARKNNIADPSAELQSSAAGQGSVTNADASVDLQSLGGVVSELRSELDAKIREMAELVQTQAASSADAIAQLQRQLQQAETERAAQVDELTQLRHDLQESQMSVAKLEDAIRQAEEEHAAALQVWQLGASVGGLVIGSSTSHSTLP